MLALLGVGFISCGGDDDDVKLSISPESVSMYYEDTQQLTPSEKVDSWISENEFVAKVSSTGLVTGGHIGSTRIKAIQGNRTAYSTITINPKYNLFDTPVTDFGASMSSIKSKETHKLYSESDNIIYYTYAEGNHPCLVYYTFKNGKMSGIMAILKESDYATAGYYLLERYQPAGTTNGLFVFLNEKTKEKATMSVTLGLEKVSGSYVTGIMYLAYPDESYAPSRRSIPMDDPVINNFLQ